jgi:hypothetical protein
VDVSVRDRTSLRRCPYCHALVTRLDDGWVCASCGTLHHDECFRELGRCAIHGCARTTGTEVRSPGRRRPSRLREAVTVPLILGAVVGGGLARPARCPASPTHVEPTHVEPPAPPTDSPPTRPAVVKSPPIQSPALPWPRSERRGRGRVRGAGFAGARRIFAHDEEGNLDVYDATAYRWIEHHTGSSRGATFCDVTREYALVGTPFDEDRPDLAVVDVRFGQEASRIRRGTDGWRAATSRYVLPEGVGLLVLLATTNGRFELWDAFNEHGLLSFKGDETVTTLAISPHGTKAVSGNLDGVVRVWDLRKGLEIAHFPTGRGEIVAIRYPEKGLCVVGATTGDRTHVFELDLEDGTISGELSADSPAHVIGIHAYGRRAVAGSATGDIFVFDLEAATVRHLPETDSIESVSFCGDGTHFVTTPFGPGPLVVRDSKTGSIDYTVPVE